MDIKKYIKECHKAAIEKGFYDCLECDPVKIALDDNEDYFCSICHGTGIIQRGNIGELLMLIVSELSEALEAHRKNKHSDKMSLSTYLYDELYFSHDDNNKIEYFENNIKGTFEDELADVFIRLFDLCGYLKLNIDEINYEVFEIKHNNIGEMLFVVTKEITNYPFTQTKEIWIGFVFESLFSIIEKLKIPIEKHIIAKMEYNKTRPRKHGKEC